MKSKLIKSPSVIVSVVLVIAIIFLLYFNQISGLVTKYDYTSGIITEFVGIVVTILFVQYLFDKKSQEEEEKEEIEAIKRADTIMQFYIERYINAFYSVATPIENRNGPSIMPEEFNISDMYDLHTVTLRINEGLESSVDIFNKYELLIRNHMIETLRTINFKYNIRISEIFLCFIEASIRCDTREAMKNTDRQFGNERLSDFISRLMRTEGDILAEQIGNGQVEASNLLTPYILLHDMMGLERDLILEYQNLIANLD